MSAAEFEAATPPRKPNTLFILMDDLGYLSFSCCSNEAVKRPRLDCLAQEGVRFTNAYVAPQCTPYRAARNRIWHVIPWHGLPEARVRAPEFQDNLPRQAGNYAGFFPEARSS